MCGIAFLPPPACQSGRRVHSESSPTPALCTGMPDWWNPRCLQTRCCRDTKTRETQLNIFHSPSFSHSPLVSVLLPHGVTSHFFAPASNELPQEGVAQGGLNSNWNWNPSLMMYLLLMSYSGLPTARCGHLANPRLCGPVTQAGWLVWSVL